MRSGSFRLLACLALALMVAGKGVHAQAPFVEGEDYVAFSSPKPITDASADQVAVVEWMWHGCPHCHDFEPVLSSWLEKAPEEVRFVRKPAVPRQAWVPTALAYLFAKEHGVAGEIHEALFRRIHEEGKNPRDLDWILALFEERGLGSELRAYLNSKTRAQEQLSELQEQQGKHAITAVPTVIVDGRFKVTRELAGGSYQRMVEIIDYLVYQRIQEKKSPDQ